MPQQQLPEDLHSKRVETDADYWVSWLERLAEIRREREPLVQYVVDREATTVKRKAPVGDGGFVVASIHKVRP